jgi:hypothetical protein
MFKIKELFNKSSQNTTAQRHSGEEFSQLKNLHYLQLPGMFHQLQKNRLSAITVNLFMPVLLSNSVPLDA